MIIRYVDNSDRYFSSAVADGECDVNPDERKDGSNDGIGIDGDNKSNSDDDKN